MSAPRPQRQVKRVRYYWVPKRNIVVCTTQRAASTTMAEALAPNFDRSMVVTQGRAHSLQRDGARVLLWIRDPLDRLACAYPIFGRNPYTPGVVSPDEYAEKILAAGNPHWSPQTSLHRVAGHGFLPTHVYPFESLAESWPMELPKHPLQHIGAQPDRMSWDELEDAMHPKLILRIISHWKVDIVLHRIALTSWESTREPEHVQNVEVAA